MQQQLCVSHAMMNCSSFMSHIDFVDSSLHDPTDVGEGLQAVLDLQTGVSKLQGSEVLMGVRESDTAAGS